jgi:hypothetical protein
VKSTSASPQLRPVIHIGPPKTGSTAIQSGLIPLLGRPYEIKTHWSSALASAQDVEIPPLPSNVIISDEALGRFKTKPPEKIARKLSDAFPGAVIIYVRRSPVDLFYSVYRQGLINGIAALLKPEETQLILPPTPNVFFDESVKQYKRFRCGLLAMIGFGQVRAAFEPFFDFNVLDFDQLANAPREFTRTFAAICGENLDAELQYENVATTDALESFLSSVKEKMPPQLQDVYREYYSYALLTMDRQEQLCEFAA